MALSTKHYRTADASVAGMQHEGTSPLIVKTKRRTNSDSTWARKQEQVEYACLRMLATKVLEASHSKICHHWSQSKLGNWLWTSEKSARETARLLCVPQKALSPHSPCTQAHQHCNNLEMPTKLSLGQSLLLCAPL